ncbi:hypothetical protein ACFFJN_03235 [Erwinia mallotivora]|uniref:hypothetical protein n=1 Tax=Erwinia mallotivora TaxID=69222 RepID=UPI0035E908CF
MGSLQVAVILLCGYFFVTNSIGHRYNFKRTTGWDAYLYIAVYGVMFACAGWFLYSVLSLAGFFRWAEREYVSVETLRRLFPVVSYSGSAGLNDLKVLIWSVCSVLVAVFFAAVQKYRFSDEARRIRVLSKVASCYALDTLLIDAFVNQFPIIVTSKSRKVYVGIVFSPQLENGHCEFLTLLPLLSGFRDKENLKVTFSVNYQLLYKEQGISSGFNCSRLLLEDFITLIPKQEIDNVSFFDLATYEQFQLLKKK